MYSALGFVLLDLGLPKSCFSHFCFIERQPKMVIGERRPSNLTAHLTAEAA